MKIYFSWFRLKKSKLLHNNLRSWPPAEISWLLVFLPIFGFASNDAGARLFRLLVLGSLVCIESWNSLARLIKVCLTLVHTRTLDKRNTDYRKLVKKTEKNSDFRNSPNKKKHYSLLVQHLQCFMAALHARGMITACMSRHFLVRVMLCELSFMEN